MIDAKTQVCAVIGDPVAHSLSPAIHNAAFQERGLDFVYVGYRVDPKDVDKAIAGVRGFGMRGLSVTIPHKVAVMELLDEIDPVARGIGALNTVVREEDGRLLGYNTDASGALAALRAAGTPLEGSRVVLVGSGGAARAIAFALVSEAKIAGLTITDIDKKLLEGLAADLSALGKAPIDTALSEDATYARLVPDAQVLINASPLGMSPKTDATPVDAAHLHAGLTVFDVVYNPLRTRLLQEAHSAGCRTVPGAEMFIQQAVAQFELWTGVDAPVEVMRRVVLDALSEK